MSMAHNNFAVVHGSKRVPREISTDSRVHVDAFAFWVFGGTSYSKARNTRLSSGIAV